MRMLFIEYRLNLVSRNSSKYLLNKCISSDGYSVKIEGGSFLWSNLVHDPLILKKSVICSLFSTCDESALISSIDLRIRQGSVVAIVGAVGSGKSSILATLLGEMNKVCGHVSVSGKIAYVPQTPWVMNTTLKENILFGQDFDQKLYDQVIEACALKQDFGKSINRW